ncbi:MAG: hypothetical protein HC902_12900 [Calothrix sp. SM1_5_4]|nr:hypothetical protein [Calothrix sp. SM1_5_4]
MSRNQRKLGNFFKSSKLSQGYHLHILSGGMVFIAILVIYAAKILTEVNVRVGMLPEPHIAAELQDNLMTVGLLFIVSFMIFVVCTTFYLIVIGHRVGGPVVAICSYIEELKKGNFSTRRALRKNDELIPIMTKLQELAAILEKNKSGDQ